jgi:hypothetical protein
LSDFGYGQATFEIRLLAPSTRLASGNHLLPLQSALAVGIVCYVQSNFIVMAETQTFDSSFQDPLSTQANMISPYLSRFQPLQRVLSHDVFDRGHNGWMALMPYQPFSLLPKSNRNN